MSEEIKKINVFDVFAQTQMTFQEAEEKTKQESGAPKVERFRMGEDGAYSVRILPLAPSFDDQGNIVPMDRKGYEYPVHQMFLKIKLAQKKGKSKPINIPVIRTTDKGVGYSVDLIDTYVKIAKEMYGDDEELISFIEGSSYNGGLQWGYQHAMMVLDTSSKERRAKGPLMFQCSHSQYKMIDGAKMRLWRELLEDNAQQTCPITAFKDAYPVNITRKTEKKTEYTIEIGRKTTDITEEEAQKLLELPRIPELIYRYTRYQMEATVVFLQQFDEAHDMEVCKEPDFMEAVEKLKGELPKDDTSHFDLSGAASKLDSKDKVTIDSLWTEYDNIVDQDLNEKSDEYQELREKIRQFIEDNGLDVRMSRTKNNQQMLEEIEQALDEAAKTPDAESKKGQEANSKGESTPCHSQKPIEYEPDDDAEVENEDDDSSDDEPAAPEPPVQQRTRRARPGSEVAQTQADDKPAEDAQDNSGSEDAPRRRLHNRRLR